MRSNTYQYSLIALGVVSTILFGAFFMRELFPEYRIYQDDYVALEEFRSTYTHEPPPDFKIGIKQIVFERDDKGPARIDRCTSCHVALQFPHFSPTKIAYDVNGEIRRDAQGNPLKIPNDDYVWGRLDDAIASLRKEGKDSKADEYEALKTAHVGEHTYDVTMALRMHPLMGRETRPFEYHPIEEYGCTSCHSGNGRGLTTDKAHGPVFDGQYEEEFMGPEPSFTEDDPDNDPKFARVFNHKPGAELLFQTSPILVGGLIEAKCMQCHQESAQQIQSAAATANDVLQRRGKRTQAIRQGFQNEVDAVAALVQLRTLLSQEGSAATLEQLKKKAADYSLPQKEMEQAQAQVKFLLANSKALDAVNSKIEASVGSQALATLLIEQSAKEKNLTTWIPKFLEEHQKDPGAKGSLFEKQEAADLEIFLLRHISENEQSFSKGAADQALVGAMTSDVDLLTKHYSHGQQLFISQACYACHRIAGYSRGGVGPELTREGESYPWFIKESIVWPQADLRTSTMPNFRLDHEEVGDLVTFLLGQTGNRKSVSETAYKVTIQEWEAGKRLPWEKAITPGQIHDVNYSMMVFATEGCAACHRLKGFESNVGFKIEKEKPDFAALLKERDWFKQMVPEMVIGSELVAILEKNGKEIDQRIVDDVRTGSIVEQIDAVVPDQVESLYTPFKYASRAKNSFYEKAIAAEKDPAAKAGLEAERGLWKERVHRVLMMFIQEYGFGRLIGPRPNWSGVDRSDEWLMEHFKNPSGHVPRSIMPVFPFDDTKFYALTYMLDVLGKRNRDELRREWNLNGFNPAEAFQIHCSQCHGEFMQGNGPVSEWIYPIPKNLRNTDFLRNLTKERVIQSITHGVKGTPMPPWGEVGAHKTMMDNLPVLTTAEINQLADWIFSFLPGGTVIRESSDVPKWQYTPEDVLKELQQEGGNLQGGKDNKQGNAVLTASLIPFTSSEGSEKPLEIFDAKTPPLPGPDAEGYYIKKRFYTQQNIDEGRAFFELNCSPCHGSEADGSGARAEAMKDAKPRMLTNLDWVNSRDDMRLLRSIKYGVPGTGMTPWGDLTTSLQRLQLVMFIRSLTLEQEKRDRLSTSLFNAYDQQVLAVEDARIQEYPALAKLEKEYDTIRDTRRKLYDEQSDASVNAYRDEMKTYDQLKQRQDVDKLLSELRDALAKEKEVYQSVGLQLMKIDSDQDFSLFIDAAALNGGSFSFADGKLIYKSDGEREAKIDAVQKQVTDDLNSRIQELQQKKSIEEGKFSSLNQRNELQRLNTEISNITKVKDRFISGMEETKRLRERQGELYAKYSKEPPKV